MMGEKFVRRHFAGRGLQRRSVCGNAEMLDNFTHVCLGKVSRATTLASPIATYIFSQ